ncbi:hypothetical protein [Actinokineospora bangkokensis]|uniref:Uncharacterized protein n=1 Tax=Actinokineospora bangkokensis TaxID=1193682 RepID=A0A1Q9LS72_9PSEU|nr:hypothetical protein [Actinokineospora bangkokensis]OLR94882.1 hypothetical protein BJP25_09700 [Actinokineospora bangkokensis]
MAGAPPERVPLSLVDGAGGRRRTTAAVLVVVVLAAAVGGVVGLIGGRVPALVAAAVVAVPLGLLAWGSARRQVWLEGSQVVARTFGKRRVDLRTARGLELVVTDLRGTRTVGLLVSGDDKRAVNVSLAVYSGTGGRELGILVLRKLADLLAGSENTAGLVFSQLLVAQLRAEAKGEPAPDRPLYRLASVAPEGRLAQRLKPEAITRFVASLD